jgi:starch phosphorylase
MRTSMAQMAPRFSSNRMLREYVEQIYPPATARVRERTADGGRLASALVAWHATLERYWPQLHFGTVQVQRKEKHWHFQVQVYLGEVDPAGVRVELYAKPWEGQDGVCAPMVQGESLPGAVHGYLYCGSVPATRLAEHFTPRIIPMHPAARMPLEASQILWQR